MASRGYLYRQKGRDGAPLPTWWCKYYRDGVPIRESTGTDKHGQALRFLTARAGKVAAGEPVLVRADKVRYEEAEADLVAHYETTGSRKLSEVRKRLKHLTPFFAGDRLARITGAAVTRYVERRQRAEAANGTINRELAILTKMLRLAYENQKLLRLPVIHKLEEAAPRQGFFEGGQDDAGRAALGSPRTKRGTPLPPRLDLQAAAAIAYTYGWRMQSEVLTLERRQVDAETGTLRLEPGTTKNDDGRLVYLTPERKTLLAAELEPVRALEKKLGRIIPFVFPHLRGRRRGERIGDFRKAWLAACKQAGVV